MRGHGDTRGGITKRKFSTICLHISPTLKSSPTLQTVIRSILFSSVVGCFHVFSLYKGNGTVTWLVRWRNSDHMARSSPDCLKWRISLSVFRVNSAVRSHIRHFPCDIKPHVIFPLLFSRYTHLVHNSGFIWVHSVFFCSLASRSPNQYFILTR